MSRVNTKKGLYLPAHQVTDYVPNKIETVSIPSLNTPNWGSMFTVEVHEQNVTVQELCLQFNVNAITGMTGSVMFVPTPFWIDHIDYVFNGNIIDTYTPLNQFLESQLFEPDEQRAVINYMHGNYGSTAQRIALAAAQSTYYLSLYDFFKQSKSISLLEQAHSLQLRIFLQPLANVAVGTGTAVATINSCNLLLKVNRLSENEAGFLKMELNSRKVHYSKFNDLLNQSYTVNTGVVTTNIVLSAITGPISHLIFVVRPSASLTGNSAFSFTAIQQFELLNSSGQNINGGQAILSGQSLLLNGKDWTASSYLTEESSYGTTNNNANVYMYSFSADPISTARYGHSLGSHNFSGSDQLKLTFTAALAAQVQVDVLAYQEGVIAQSKLSVNKAVYWH